MEMSDYIGKLSEIDVEMARLFEKRMEVCRNLAEYRRENALSVKDPGEEKGYVDEKGSLIGDDEIRSYYVRFLGSAAALSADFQESLSKGLKVAYGGTEGAYAHIASGRMFPGARLISKPDFAEAYRSVERGENDVAVIPIENSLAGEVGVVMDLIYQGSLFINQVYDLSIRHQLLGIKGSRREDIKTVISHPQALAQCSSYISRGGYDTEEAANTSAAARSAAARGEMSVGAIASIETAKVYDLQVLDSDIQNPGINTTRFAAFCRSLMKDTGGGDGGNFILVFTVRNEAGALAQALNIIGAHGFNMRSLRSRPLKLLPWNYYFYVEAEGDINSQEGSDMLRELGVICADLKLVGTYK